MDSSNMYLFHVIFRYIRFCYVAKSLPKYITKYFVRCYYKRSFQQEKDSCRQQILLKIKEETNKVLLLEHNDLQSCDFDTSKIRSEIPGTF